MKTALLLAGGGARGIIQAGMLNHLSKSGVKIDSIYGSSVGALNGAMYVTGRMSELLDLWRQIKNKDVYSFNPLSVVFGKSIYDTKPLRKLIEKAVNGAGPTGAPKDIRFYANTTDLDTWAPYAVEIAGWLPGTTVYVDWLMASAAAPIAFPPVEPNPGRGYHADGGLVNNFSVAQAVNDGADRLIVMTPTVPEPKPIKSVVDMLDVALALPSWGYLMRELKFVEKLNNVPGFRKIEVILVQPRQATGIQLLDFDLKGRKRDELIAYGEHLAQNAFIKAGVK